MTGPARAPVPVRLVGEGRGLVILDQTVLPGREEERTLTRLEEMEEAIRSLRVRGAPLIGITAALGVAVLAKRAVGDAEVGKPSAGALAERVHGWCDRLAATRPTAVNLAWALARMRTVTDRVPRSAPAAELARGLVEEARAVLEEDRAMCRRIGEHALALLGRGDAPLTLLTHCNAGALATGGIGTALAPMYLARERGRPVRVFADETRPLLQGSRLTAWELGRAGVDVTVLTDGMAGALMVSERPDAVLVGADRIAANGDTANKIGTYGLGVLARHHGIPFYVLAPTSTVDPAAATGADIPIEHRAADEVRRGFGPPTAPDEARVWSPAFDVTPADLVTAIVTEQGVARPPFGPALREAMDAARAERGGGGTAEAGRSAAAAEPGDTGQEGPA